MYEMFLNIRGVNIGKLPVVAGLGSEIFKCTVSSCFFVF